MWVDMLPVDVNATMMQATINASGLPRFRSRLAAGTMFSVSGFDVSGVPRISSFLHYHHE
ncbi:hypothetical protein YC2023_090003 [Brassica napus]